MHKIVIHSPGGYDKLKLEEHPTPQPGPDEVLIETAACGVNYADCIVRWGQYDSAKKYVGWPITPGFEFAGTVSAIGEKVRDVAIGSRMFGITLFHGYASHVLVRPQQIFPIPHGFTLEQAAAFSTVAITAYHALYQNMQLRQGMKILVHSAAGGVGSVAVQLAKIAGCHVVGVVGSSHKVEHVRSLGADVIIDKSRENLWDAAKAAATDGYDAVLDANGHTTLRESYNHLRATGKLFTFGFHSMLPRSGGRINYLLALWGLLKMPRFNPLMLTRDNKGVIGFNLSFLFDRFDLLNKATRDLLAWAEQGKLRPPETTSFPLAQAAEAHKLIESGKSIGKIVLIP